MRQLLATVDFFANMDLIPWEGGGEWRGDLEGIRHGGCQHFGMCRQVVVQVTRIGVQRAQLPRDRLDDLQTGLGSPRSLLMQVPKLYRGWSALSLHNLAARRESKGLPWGGCGLRGLHCWHHPGTPCPPRCKACSPCRPRCGGVHCRAGWCCTPRTASASSPRQQCSWPAACDGDNDILLLWHLESLVLDQTQRGQSQWKKLTHLERLLFWVQTLNTKSRNPTTTAAKAVPPEKGPARSSPSIPKPLIALQKERGRCRKMQDGACGRDERCSQAVRVNQTEQCDMLSCVESVIIEFKLEDT